MCRNSFDPWWMGDTGRVVALAQMVIAGKDLKAGTPPPKARTMTSFANFETGFITQWTFVCYRSCGRYVLNEREMRRRYLDALRRGVDEILLAS